MVLDIKCFEELGPANLGILLTKKSGSGFKQIDC